MCAVPAVNFANGLWTKMVNMTPAKFIATSLIAKDAVGCYLYVTQARSNKKFTPKQRADVANYDLANGVINVGLQLLAVSPIEKLMTKFVEGCWIKKFLKGAGEGASNKALTDFLKQKSMLTKGAVAVLSAIICQYVIKRGISPFFSVPAGEKLKQLGLVKPKLYAGETFTGREDLDQENTKAPDGSHFDVLSTADADTNLVNRGVKHYKQS